MYVVILSQFITQFMTCVWILSSSALSIEYIFIEWSSIGPEADANVFKRIMLLRNQQKTIFGDNLVTSDQIYIDLHRAAL